MSDESASKPPAAPTLCKMDCGFFGSDATGNLCSKCWMESMKEKSGSAPTVASGTRPIDTCQEIPGSKHSSREETEEDVAVAPYLKATMKRRKKSSYKAFMNTLLASGQSPSEKTQKDQSSLQQGLGGGQFKKIEKI